MFSSLLGSKDSDDVGELNRPALLPRVIPQVDGARGEGDRGIGKQPDRHHFQTGDKQQKRYVSLTRQPEGTIYRYLTGISKPRDLRERKMVGKYIERPLQLTKTSALTSGLLRGASYPH